MAKKRYTPAPVVPRETAERLAKVMEVLGGKTTVAQAARELGLSRNHFQSILHRGIAGLAESITPKAGGRPARPEEMKALQEENERLQRELSRLQERAQIAERVMQATSELLQGRLRPARQSRPRKATGRSDEEADSESRLAAVETMRRCGFAAEHAARMAGVHPATARRWRSCLQHGLPDARRTRERRIEPRAQREVELRVRRLHGLIGADALRHCVPGVS